MKALNKCTLLLHSLSMFVVFTAIFFIILTSVGGYIGTDIYYHVQHATHIAIEGISALTAQSWLPQHFFSLHPVNPYLLYHLLVAGILVITGNTVQSMLTVLLLSSGIASLFFTTTHIILRSYRVPYASLWTIAICLGSTSFIYRLLLIRPFTFGIIFCMLGTWLLIHRRYWWAGLTSIIYILTYNLAVFLILPAIVVIFVRGVIEKSWSLKPLIAVLGGITIGLLIHPQTLSYVLLIKAHLIDIFVLQLRGVSLPIGGEIVPQITRTFFALHIFPLLLYIISIIILAAKLYTPPSQLRVPIYSYAILSLCWFPIAVGVHRGLEYWYPMTCITIALVLSNYWTIALPTWPKQLRTKFLIGTLSLTLITITAVYVLFFLNVWAQAATSYDKVTEIQPFISILDTTTSTIWYPAWDIFPILLYSLPKPVDHTFVAGFDPVFTYQYNEDTYYSWYLLSTEGIACFSTTDCPTSLMPSDVIYNLFGSKLIISPINTQTTLFRQALDADPNIIPVQKNEKYRLYTISK